MTKKYSQEWQDRSCAAWLARRIRKDLLSILAALTVALAALPVPAYAQGRTVRVGVNADYGISTVGGSNSGFAMEYLREIKKRTDDNYEYVSGTAQELAEKLAAGEIDLVPCVTEQELSVWEDAAAAGGYHDGFVLGSFPLMAKFSAIYVSGDSSIAFSDLDTLRTKRIGYLAEDQGKYFPNGEFVMPELRSAELIAYNTEDQMHSDFDSGKIDAVAKDCFRSWSNDLIVCQLTTAECYFMGTEDSRDIISDIDAAIGGIMMTDNSFSADMYEKYVAKYGYQRYAYTESEKYYIDNNPFITVGVNVQASMLDSYDGKNIIGVTPQALQELSRISGINIRLMPFDSIKDCIAAMREGKVQAICGGVNASSMAEYTDIRVSAPYHRAPVAAAGKTGTTIGERSRIAIPAAADDISVYIASIYPNAPIQRYASEKLCLDAVAGGQADLTFSGAYELMYALNGGYGDLDIIAVKDTTHLECLAFPADSTDLANIMGKSLAVMSVNSTLVNTYSAIISNNSHYSGDIFVENYLVWIVAGMTVVLGVIFAVVCITTFRSRRVADIDPLTGGRSKHKYFEDTRRLLKKTGAENWAIALFDIDKFKYVNDRLGYEEGNRMLERLHKTVSDHLEGDEIFARLSDDNFVLTIKNSTDIEITSRINNIFSEFERRNSLFVKYPVVFSAGVCRMNQCIHENGHGEVDINAAIDRCKIAKSTLKGTHFSSIAFYDGSIRDRALREKDYENMMPAALEKHEFQCYLQPKYGLRSRNIEGAEALIRWNSKDFGFISPGDFIPIAEKNGFVVELDFFILEEVCRTMRHWIDEGRKPVVVSVNQSRLHLNYDDYIWRLREIVDKYDIPYEYIELELTESVFTENSEKLLKIMHKLHEIGFKLSLDDFGSGYSSLNMLKDMPVDVVKIDKEFFSDTMNTQKGRAVISTVVDLAKNLDMDVISEGVETKEQVEFLTEIHCAMVQGYYFAKPMPISDFEKLWYDNLADIKRRKEAAAAKQQQRLDALEHSREHAKEKTDGKPAIENKSAAPRPSTPVQPGAAPAPQAAAPRPAAPGQSGAAPAPQSAAPRPTAPVQPGTAPAPQSAAPRPTAPVQPGAAPAPQQPTGIESK